MQLSLYQQLISEGEALKREGMQRAITHAENENPGWKEKCWQLFKEWLWVKPKGYEFMCEDFRLHVERNAKLEVPPSRRAFGFIPRQAVKEKLIEFMGIGTVKNAKAHAAKATVWRKIGE